MSGCAPIAIVGRGCVLPGALTPGDLWRAIMGQRSLLTPAPPGVWGLTSDEQAELGYVGGFVTGFDQVFDPAAHARCASDVEGLDSVFKWSLHAARAAYIEAGSPDFDARRAGVILANLSYPSRLKADQAGDIWAHGRSDLDVRNAFNSGRPAQLIASSLGIEGGAFSLDAACASSLYAIEMACQKLTYGDLDMVVVGAVNASDNLMLHKGFEALQALSPSGQSRPFSRSADGLVPSEGAGAVVLKRLSDVSPSETVFGIIRGVGLSNDGRRRGFLAPDEDGQIEAMRRAYDGAGIAPDTVDYLECHATGTLVGDAAEVRSSAAVFADSAALPIGSLKANLGHLITVAGMASLIKLTEALRHETLPGGRVDTDIIDAFEGAPVHPLRTHLPWAPVASSGARSGAKSGAGVRRAAISNFGFGGNNAHLILDGPEHRSNPASKARPIRIHHHDDIVICGMGALAGPDMGMPRIIRRLMSPPQAPMPFCETISINPLFARTPPSDLIAAEPAHLAMLAVSEEALQDVAPAALERSGVFVAMGCAADSARWLLRERLMARHADQACTAAVGVLRDQIAAPITAADVLGAMPNMPANRLSVALDYRGRGFTLSAEAQSSDVTLSEAIECLRSGALDLALVGAADFASEPVRASALKSTGITAPCADMAAAIILKRRSQAITDGDRILGVVSDGLSDRVGQVSAVYGRAPIAEGLLGLAVSHALAGRTLTPRAGGVSVNLSGGASQLAVASPDPLRPAPYLYWAAARSPAALAKRLDAGRVGGVGDHRIAIVERSAQALTAQRHAAAAALREGKTPAGERIWYGHGAPDGELAFVFTGSAAAYPRMGRGLFMAFPALADSMHATFPEADQIAHLLSKPELTAYEQLCAVTLVSQAQTLLLREHLGVSPDAVMGLSLGETNSLIAFRFWKDAGHLLDAIAADAMYERHLGGAFETAREAWGWDRPADWRNWRIYAPMDRVRAAIAETQHTEITIIYTQEDCVIGGPAAECEAVARALGPGAAVMMNQHLIVHAEAMAPYGETWRALHTRPTSRQPDVRIYANAIHGAYTPTKSSAADMLTRQAVACVDFPKTVEQAYADGVRTFVEIGPRDTLALSIGKILGDRPHTALAADRIEASDLEQITRTCAALFADGRSVDLDALQQTLTGARTNVWPDPPGAHASLSVPAHYSLPSPAKLKGLTMTIPPKPQPVFAAMPPAPDLPPPAAEAGPMAPPVEALPPPVKVAGPQPLMRRTPIGPSYTRAELEAATDGSISDLFGDLFAEQDGYVRQVRLPMAPLLLVDRITGIDAQPGVDGGGVIWTETDVDPDAFYMHDGFMRPGPLIEAGQADLSLISWMGADLRNRDERVYRLLGCELTLHEGGLPRAGDTLKYQIEITGHATLSGVRMFFFQYDCYVGDRRLFSVRNGQAGFFTDEELAAGKGVLWDAATEGAPTPSAAAPDTSHASAKRRFTAADLDVFRAGDAYACFGDGFEPCAAATNPPRLGTGKLALFDEVEAFEPAGGPWGRGYLRARAHVPVDAWFYDGHFHNDPCMPGTLMAEAAVQALEFHAAAMGLTIDRDGFIFEPMVEAQSKFICRGQVIPDAPHDVTYEVFIDEIIDGETPEIYATLLATSDGKKVFYCPRFGVRLRRNWPVVAPDIERTPIGPLGESRGDWAALKACGDGAPSDAFGAMYAQFDHAGRVPRLPQPPYHMISRVCSISTRPNAPEPGATVVTEYDVADDAWYFGANGNDAMPFAVLVEVVLQPCGWLASHGGFALQGGECFRNLDGDGHVYHEVRPGDGPIRVESKMTKFSRAGSTTIVFFELTATLPDGRLVMDLETSFGFFPMSSLVTQVGLKISDEDTARLALPGSEVKVKAGKAKLPHGQMQMLDGVDYFDPGGGTSGLGLIRGRQAIDPYAWYFKAHFYQDPVQPGSLGLDALVQVLKRAVLLKGLKGKRFESVAAGQPVGWTYRGQVTPIRKQVTAVMEITSISDEDGAVLVNADGSLWCDGLKIYGAKNLSVRLWA